MILTKLSPRSRRCIKPESKPSSLHINVFKYGRVLSTASARYFSQEFSTKFGILRILRTLFIMSDAAASPKKAVKAKKPAAKPTHPPVAAMVTAAITALKDRKGSSLPAIKKYVAATYKVDVAKLAPFIRKFLKKAVADGKLAQVKGSGASGSFKLAKAAPAEKKPKKKVAKKPAAKKSPKKAAKKPAAKKAKKAKTPKKEKKAKKPAAAKPKKPKAKKAKTPKKAAKKPAAKKAAK